MPRCACAMLVALSLAWIAPRAAWADVVPPVERPGWDTPAPLPLQPELALVWVAMFVLVASAIVFALLERAKRAAPAR